MKNFFQKHLLIKAFLISIAFFTLAMITYSFASAFSINKQIAEMYGYTIFVIIIIKNNKDEIIKNFKDLKKLTFIDILKIVTISLLFTTLMVISNRIIYKLTGNIADTEELNRSLIKDSPIAACITMMLVGPIAEELIFRYPYRIIKKHRLLTYIIFSLIFAFMHINITSLNDAIFIIPYMFLSLSIGFGFYKTNNILMSIIYHILNNSLTIMLLFI